MLVGRAGACQKSLPLTEGMIHSREREKEGGRQAAERERNGRDKEREKQRGRDAGKKTGMLI